MLFADHGVSIATNQLRNLFFRHALYRDHNREIQMAKNAEKRMGEALVDIEYQLDSLLSHGVPWQYIESMVQNSAPLEELWLNIIK